MQLQEYIEKSSRTSADLESPIMNNLHYTIGMVTEIGELLDVFKKNIAYNKDIDWVNVSEEIGDLCWYLANFVRINNIDLEKIWDINIAKLQARYPDKFTEYHAQNRDLEKERTILES